MKTYTASCDECGYTTSPSRSEAQAAYGLRRHSCDAHRKRQARAARVAARKAASGPRRDCHCPIANHQHGTHVAYVIDKCRCRECRDAAAAYENRRNKDRAYGREPYVPADQARAHVLHLGAQGMGWKRVAKAAGLESSVVWKLIYGDRKRGMPPSRRIRPETEAKILAVTLDLAHGAYIDGTGTRRRLQALCAIGWSQSELGRRIGIPSAGNMGVLIHGRQRTKVAVATARKVAMLYDQLWDKPPQPTEKFEKTAKANALRAARRHGWVSPLAWDDDTIDDPNATPDLGEPEVGRHSRQRFTIDDVEFLLSTADYTRAGLAARLHVTPSAIEQACHRKGRRYLWDRLIRNETGELRQEAS